VCVCVCVQCSSADTSFGPIRWLTHCLFSRVKQDTHKKAQQRSHVCMIVCACVFFTFVNTHTCTQEIQKGNKSKTKRGSKTGYIPLSPHPRIFDIASSSSSPSFSSSSLLPPAFLFSLPHSLSVSSHLHYVTFMTVTACQLWLFCYCVLQNNWMIVECKHLKDKH